MLLSVEAAYRFFKTQSEEDSLKRSGKSEVKKVARRRQERISRVSTTHVYTYTTNLSTYTHMLGYCIHLVYDVHTVEI